MEKIMSDWNTDNQEQNLPDLRKSAKFAAWDLKQIGIAAKKISESFDELISLMKKLVEKGGQQS
jgi:hypothetical protein